MLGFMEFFNHCCSLQLSPSEEVVSLSTSSVTNAGTDQPLVVVDTCGVPGDSPTSTCATGDAIVFSSHPGGSVMTGNGDGGQLECGSDCDSGVDYNCDDDEVDTGLNTVFYNSLGDIIGLERPCTDTISAEIAARLVRNQTASLDGAVKVDIRCNNSPIPVGEVHTATVGNAASVSGVVKIEIHHTRPPVQVGEVNTAVVSDAKGVRVTDHGKLKKELLRDKSGVI